MELASARHGSGRPVLLLVHGVGATGAVWVPVFERVRATWPGEIVIPDLRGHGRSPHARSYGLGLYAADLAELIGPEAAVYVVGHSLGGALALLLASRWFGLAVAGVLAFSVKPRFTPEELERGRTFAGTAPRRFAMREEALARYRRVAGLEGLVSVDSPLTEGAIVEREGAWELAADPKTVLAAGPDSAPLFAAAQGKRIIATGANDPIAPADELRALAPGLRVIADAGHNVHVEQPEAVARLIAELAA